MAVKAKQTKSDLMEALFLVAAETLISRLRSGEATPSDVKNAIQFLKDNNINCDVKSGPTHLMQELISELPFLGDEEIN